jgi:hypothetical protein
MKFFTHLAALLLIFFGSLCQAQTIINRAWLDTTGHPVENSYFQTARLEGSYVYVAGSTYHQGQSANLLITKYTTTGTKIWQKEFNTSSNNADLITDLYVKGSYYYATGTIGTLPTPARAYLPLRAAPLPAILHGCASLAARMPATMPGQVLYPITAATCT